jgi:hypothetical protein
MNDSYAQLKDLPVENAESSSEGNITKTSEIDERPGKGRPPRIILIWEANLIRAQRKLKSVVSSESFRNTAARTRITTNRMMGYNTT